MTIGRSKSWSRGIRTLIEACGCVGLPDHELLERFVHGDSTAAESAFEALVERHGRMVLRACRATLHDRHDAEDAFQATFLVLALRARSLLSYDSLGPWLYRVARHTTWRARAASARRRRHEHARSIISDRIVASTSHESAEILHEEIDRLPSQYRIPVVLCHLEGQTCEEAARTLNLPVGTIKSRLARARGRLRTRLTRRGLAPSVAVTTLAIPTTVAFAVPQRLCTLAAMSAFRFLRRQMRGLPPTTALAFEVRRIFFMKKLLSIALSIAAVALVGLGASLAASGRPLPAVKATIRQEPKKDVAKPRALASAQSESRRVTVAPRNLVATAGRGSANMFVLNEKGDKIREKDNGEIPQIPAKPRRPRRSASDVSYKEVDRPLSWAVVVGTLEYRAIREAFLGKDVRDIESEYQLCRRIDLQRQTRSPDGTWTAWTDVDNNANYQILDNLIKVARERTRTDVRLLAFVDPLPFLKSGEWRGVDVDAFLDPNGEKAPMIDFLAHPRPPSPLPADEVMIRCIDFTVQPETSYRYRGRVVVFAVQPETPDRYRRSPLRQDIFGPWSEPTAAVTIPKE